jgi:hypothetical protein
MFKQLFAAACVLTCCIGNDYPAKATPARTDDVTPYVAVQAAAAVGTCWIMNGIDTQTNVYKLMNRSLARRGYTAQQVQRIMELPYFVKDVTDLIEEKGGCAGFLPDTHTKPVVQPAHRI